MTQVQQEYLINKPSPWTTWFWQKKKMNKCPYLHSKNIS